MVKTRVFLFVIYIFLINNAYSNIVLSGNYGINQLITKELGERNGKASGSSNTFKLGILNSDYEVGMYMSNHESSVSISHDNSSPKLLFDIESVGGYLTFYRRNLFLEIGYGQARIRETLQSDLEEAAISAVKEIYNLKTKEEKSSTEARFQIGYKLYYLNSLVLVGYLQKVKMLQVSHDFTELGLELKLNF